MMPLSPNTKRSLSKLCLAPFGWNSAWPLSVFPQLCLAPFGGPFGPLKFHLCPTQLSFTGAMQALEEFASCIRHRSGRYAEQWESLLQTISELTVGKRPGRQERRELKRRQKRYKLMQKPRDPNRNRYATAA